MSAVTCYNLAAVSRSPSVSTGVRARPWRQPALLPFSTTPSMYRRRPFASCASINIPPDALVHPSREAKKQQGITGGEGTTQWGIEDDDNSVKLWFVITDIVAKFNVQDDTNVNVQNAVEVVLHHDDVLIISEKKTTRNAAARQGALDVRLLMTAGYDKKPKCRWEKKNGVVRLEVTINKKQRPADNEKLTAGPGEIKKGEISID